MRATNCVRRSLAAMTLAAMLTPYDAVAAEDASRPLMVTAFGTSLTARGGWQPALEAALKACAGRDVTVQTVAKSGATSRWALEQVDRVAALKPNVVLVEFATNDAALNRFMLPSWSEENLRTIVARLRAEAPEAKIALMTMNPAIGMRGMIRPFLRTYYAIPARVAADLGVTLVDNLASWRALPAERLSAALPDGNHPTPDAAIPIVVPNVVKSLYPDCRPPAP